MKREEYYAQLKDKMKGNTYWKKTVATQFKKGHKFLGKCGDQSPNWKGGNRGSKTWNKWATAVKERDNYTCTHCNYNGGIHSKQIVAHHKVHYKLSPELKFDVSNGITLCRKCHPLYHPELVNNLKCS